MKIGHSDQKWVPDLVAMSMLDARRALKVTVLRREGKSWLPAEVSRLANHLVTETAQLDEFPEYVLLFGHFTKRQTLDAIGGGFAYTATQVTGVDDPALPFRPGWAA